MNEYFTLDYVIEQGVTPRGIIHIGAHTGEEAGYYRQYVGEAVAWIEAHPEYAAKLRDNPARGGQLWHQACVSDRTGETVDFYVTADEWASSMLKPEIHQDMHPWALVTDKIQVETITYADLLASLSPEERQVHDSANVLVLDTQGAELMVMNGMGERLFEFEAIATEYSTVEFYEGVPRLEDLDAKLAGTFRRVYPNEEQTQIHADALYLRT